MVLELLEISSKHKLNLVNVGLKAKVNVNMIEKSQFQFLIIVVIFTAVKGEEINTTLKTGNLFTRD